MPHKAQGCAGWARNPKGPQITPFCHQLGRHPTVLDATSAGFRQISARRSLGGSRPLNLNFCFHHCGANKCPNLNVWELFENGHHPAGADFGPKGPKGPHGAPWGPMGPHGGPRGPRGPRGPKGPLGPLFRVCRSVRLIYPLQCPCTCQGQSKLKTGEDDDLILPQARL